MGQSPESGRVCFGHISPQKCENLNLLYTIYNTEYSIYQAITIITAKGKRTTYNNA